MIKDTVMGRMTLQNPTLLAMFCVDCSCALGLGNICTDTSSSSLPGRYLQDGLTQDIPSGFSGNELKSYTSKIRQCACTPPSMLGPSQCVEIVLVPEGVGFADSFLVDRLRTPGLECHHLK